MKRLTKILAYSFLVLYCIPVAKPFIALSAYHMNRQLIAAELCQNADQPDLHCDGKCYLGKQMEPDVQQQSAGETSHHPMPAPEKLSEHLAAVVNSPQPAESYYLKALRKYIAFSSPGYIRSPFQPPDGEIVS